MRPTTVSVYADGDRLVQVLVNLISNACKILAEGRNGHCCGRRDTELGGSESDRPWSRYSCQDKNLLFQRFQQVDASDSKKKGGTGLGLAICKGIIEAHNGHIGVESRRGQRKYVLVPYSTCCDEDNNTWCSNRAASSSCNAWKHHRSTTSGP